ncbi:hypothetical protein RRG08_047801 [Elysia crispata]|uniref:Uncharacterized protein n=1 Tax=Elysia crispata TaxID=231223 RepID=A0AAE0Y2T4_9GAST|nr:hypothetical protein RRG08_047801 [Elysia crispata]
MDISSSEASETRCRAGKQKDDGELGSCSTPTDGLRPGVRMFDQRRLFLCSDHLEVDGRTPEVCETDGSGPMEDKKGETVSNIVMLVKAGELMQWSKVDSPSRAAHAPGSHCQPGVLSRLKVAKVILLGGMSSRSQQTPDKPR